MLNAEEYLTRIIPIDSPYICFAYKRADHMAHKFWPREQIREAADWMRHNSHTTDVYIAVAGYKQATRRIADNTHSIQCFFVDADIKREGDGKDPAKVYADPEELTAWVRKLRDEYGMPFPNLWVSSGYGMHLYWVLDQPMDRAFWTPYAEAFKSLLVASGAKGDLGVSGDIARILRAPQSFNRKVPENPLECRSLNDSEPSPINSILEILDPYRDKRNYRSNGAGLGQAHGRAAGRHASVDAAKAGLSRQPHDMARIAEHCLQVKRTLEEHGSNDAYPLWHLMVNLAYACRQREWADKIGDGHEDYTPEGTDDKWGKTEAEHQDKDFGAPFCKTFNTARPGICPGCPHWEKIETPYSLGVEVSTIDLPPGYRRHEGWIEYEVEGKDGGTFWLRLIKGDVDKPRLIMLPEGGYRLEFSYTRADRTSKVGVDERQLSFRSDVIAQYFAAQGVTLNLDNAQAWSRFMKAWIEHLRDSVAVEEAAPSFGWVLDEGDGYAGLSVGGTFYAADGTSRPALIGDPKIHQSYIPRGTLAGWQAAAEFVIAGRPELQVIVAAAFGAPIMEFTSVSGCMNIWSRESGARKSSAFAVGASVWCNPRTGMSALRDTTNAVQHALGETKIMPIYWDEVQASKDYLPAMVENIFNITQGRGKARLTSRIEAREVGQWRTLFLTSSNRPLAELIEHDRVSTDAGNVRVFEYQIEPKGEALAHAGTIVQATERHYGQAGRAYIAWVAEHWQQVRAAITLVMEQVGNEARVTEPAERFYVATVAAIIVGAATAHKLGIYLFDVAGIRRHLIAELLRQREQRTETHPLNERDRAAQDFDRFCTDHTGAMLVSQSYYRPGPRPPTLKPDLKTPQLSANVDHAVIHISIDDAELRFERNALDRWCFHNRVPFQPLLASIRKYWIVEEDRRAVIAQGTRFASGGKVAYCRVSLRHPELSHHLTDWGTPTPTSGNVVKLRP